MKKIFKLILLVILSINLYNCTSTKEKDIFTERLTENKKQLIVNYDKKNISNVKIGGRRLESGVPYYLDEGKYFISYTNNVIISGTIGISRGGRMRNRDSSHEDAIHVVLDRDKVVDIKGHRYEINVVGEKSF